MSPTLLNPNTRHGSSVRPSRRNIPTARTAPVRRVLHPRTRRNRRQSLIERLRNSWRSCRQVCISALRRVNDWTLRMWFQSMLVLSLCWKNCYQRTRWFWVGRPSAHQSGQTIRYWRGIPRPLDYSEAECRAKEIVALSLCLAIMSIAAAMCFFFAIDAPEKLGWKDSWTRFFTP